MSIRRADRKKIGKLRARRGKKVAQLRTGKQYFAKPTRFQDLWDRVVSVISKLRSEGTSLKQTSREMRVSPRTVLRYGGSALRKGADGRYQAKKSDRLLRVLMLPGPDGPREIALRGSRAATVLGEYWNAVQRYLETGDKSKLAKFRRKFITDASGTKVPLLTDLNELDRLGSAGVLSFESLYRRTE
jgi:hypothetical protein